MLYERGCSKMFVGLQPFSVYVPLHIGSGLCDSTVVGRVFVPSKPAV